MLDGGAIGESHRGELEEGGEDYYFLPIKKRQEVGAGGGGRRKLRTNRDFTRRGRGGGVYAGKGGVQINWGTKTLRTMDRKPGNRGAHLSSTRYSAYGESERREVKMGGVKELLEGEKKELVEDWEEICILDVKNKEMALNKKKTTTFLRTRDAVRRGGGYFSGGIFQKGAYLIKTHPKKTIGSMFAEMPQ